MPTLPELHRICASKSMSLAIEVAYYGTNQVQCLCIINNVNPTAFNANTRINNNIGQYSFDENGVLGKSLDIKEQTVFKKSTPCSQVALLKGKADLDSTKRVMPRSIPLIRRTSWFMNLIRFFSEETFQESMVRCDFVDWFMASSAF